MTIIFVVAGEAETQAPPRRCLAAHPDNTRSAKSALIEALALSHGLQAADALIAATAIEHGLTLLSSSVKHPSTSLIESHLQQACAHGGSQNRRRACTPSSRNRRPPGHSARMPASLITLRRRASSVFIAAANRSGVLPTISMPTLKKRSLTSGMLSTATTALFNCRIIVRAFPPARRRRRSISIRSRADPRRRWWVGPAPALTAPRS